jgi:hypothetical protein
MSHRVVYQQATQSHHCEAHREGDWIVFTCPECDYQLKDNLVTGEMQIANAKRDIAHSGEYLPLN